MTPYDSTPDTQAHIDRVRQLLTLASTELTRRGEAHDASKLVDPEKSGYDDVTPKIKEARYGTLEYIRAMADMATINLHHAKGNSYCPAHYPGGVNDFDLFDLVEMFFDMVAENPDGILGAIESASKSETLSPQVARIFYNTSQRYVKMVQKPEKGNTKSY